MRSRWIAVYSLCFFIFLVISGCADSYTPGNIDGGLLGVDAIDSDDEYILFVGSRWSNVIFDHLGHSERESNDCFMCHDHGASVGDSRWNCSACHMVNDPENLCDQDEYHGCVMAQCNFCHEQRIGSSPNVPFIDCSGDPGDTACCLDCHPGGQIAVAGVLLDSAVEGLRYQTNTLLDKTDSKGTFFYMEGEEVTFFLADLLLGTTMGGPIRTVVDLVEGATDATHPTVTNICRLLRTLDRDGDPNNGITLPEEAMAELEGLNINFKQSTDDFGNDPEVQVLIDTLNNNPNVFKNTPRNLCSVSNAQNHMNMTLESINAPPLLTFPGALKVSGSNGCNAAGCHYQERSVNGIYQIDETNYPDGMLNDKPIYKHETEDYWIHWNSTDEVKEWKLSARTNRSVYKHHYSWSETGGENYYPPLGTWPCGCSTFEGKQISARVSPLGGINGDIWVGEKLRGIYHYFDDEGDSESGTVFQWYRCDDRSNTNDVQILWADSETYILGDEDEDKYIRFGITPGALSGDSPGREFRSGPFGPIIVNEAPIANNVSISGEKHVTAMLKGTYTYYDATGDMESGTFFKWYRYPESSGNDKELIIGANSITYTLVNDDQDKYIKFEVTPGAATGSSPGIPVKSSAYGPIVPDPLNELPSVSAPVINGAGDCICVNSQLTAAYTYSDPENDPESSTYQWYIETAAGSNVYQAVSNATSTTHTVVNDQDEGKYIKFAVTPGATFGNSPGSIKESVPIRINVDPDNQVPVVSNVTIQTPVYMASQAVGHYEYYDSEENTDMSTFQWYIADTPDGTYTVISGANSQIFTPPDNFYEWKYLKFVVTPHSSWGNSPGASVESSAVQINPSLNNAYPRVNNVVISGMAFVAEALEGQYIFTDEDCDEDCCSRQWYFCATQNGTYSAISGATSNTFTPPDNGAYEMGYLKFGATPIACTGNNSPSPGEIRSEVFGPLNPALANYLPTADPEIAGEYFPGEGRKIICVKSTATGLSHYFDPEGAPDVSTYAWYVCQDPDGIHCGSVVSTETTYTPVTADLGKYLKFQVTPGSVWGNTPGVTVASETKMIKFNPNDSPPTAIVYSGIKLEGCLGLGSGGTMPAYINPLGASGVDGIYQIADTIRYTIDPNTHEPCNPKGGGYPEWCSDYYFINEPINGTVNGKVAYKHEDYYDEEAGYWIAWHPVPICQTAWWIADSLGRSRGGGAIAVGKKDTYTPPLEDWGDSCGNGVELSLYGGDSNKPGISGEPYVGSTLTGDYEYYDADGDAEGQSTFRWLRCDMVNGSYQPIPGATGKTYTLTENDENRFLNFEVTPAAVTGNSPGNVATSAYAGIGPVMAIP